MKIIIILCSLINFQIFYFGQDTIESGQTNIKLIPNEIPTNIKIYYKHIIELKMQEYYMNAVIEKDSIKLEFENIYIDSLVKINKNFKVSKILKGNEYKNFIDVIKHTKFL